MDENNQEGHSLTDETKVKPNKRLGSSVEIAMFLFFGAKTLSDTIIVNVLEKSTCLVILNYDETNCTEPISPTLSGQLQQSTADLVMARSMIEAFIPSLLSLFIGPWSDTNGRRPLILLTLIGYTVSTIMWLVLSLIPGLHPMYFLLTCFPVAFCGGYPSFFLALYCYISDVTEFDKRAIKMGLLEAACMGGVLFSSLITPYLVKTSTLYGYSIVFATSALLLVFTYLYIYFFIKESVTIVESERTKLWKLDHVKEIFSTCFRTRPNHVRTIVMFIIINLVLFIVLVDGELAVLYMFTQKKFNWNLMDYTRYSSFFIVVAGVSVIGSTWFFVSVLKFSDLPLMFVSTLCLVFKSFLQAIASSGLYLYISSSFGILSVLISPLSRSQLSKLIPPDELGKIFAFTAFVESTAPLTASPSYTFIYKATLDTMPNAVFWLSTGLSCVSAILIGSAFILHRFSTPSGFSPVLDDDHCTGPESRNVSVQA